jgi:hypothetical protein
MVGPHLIVYIYNLQLLLLALHADEAPAVEKHHAPAVMVLEGPWRCCMLVPPRSSCLQCCLVSPSHHDSSPGPNS